MQIILILITVGSADHTKMSNFMRHKKPSTTAPLCLTLFISNMYAQHTGQTQAQGRNLVPYKFGLVFYVCVCNSNGRLVKTSYQEKDKWQNNMGKKDIRKEQGH